MQTTNDSAADASNSISQSLTISWDKFQKAIHGDPAELVDLIGLWLIPSVQALGIMLACYFVAKYASKVLSMPLNRKVDETLGRFVEKLVYRGIIGAGFILVLQRFGIQSTSFAAAIAAAGFAVGLAFQGTLSNFASGVLLMVFRPFKVGDLVVAGGVTARVQEIDLFTTVVDTPDNRRLIIPNSAVSGATIENVTYHPIRRVDMPISIAHGADIDSTRAAFWAAIESIRESIYQSEDRQSAVLMTAITTTCMEWTVRVWAPTKEFHNVRDLALVAIKKHLDTHSIPLAIPQMGVSMVAASSLANPFSVSNIGRNSSSQPLSSGSDKDVSSQDEERLEAGQTNSTFTEQLKIYPERRSRFADHEQIDIQEISGATPSMKESDQSRVVSIRMQPRRAA